MTCLSLLIYLHIVFNQQPISCLSHLHETWPRQGVLRLELFLQTPPETYDLRRSYAREYPYDHPPAHPNVSAEEDPLERNLTASPVEPTESNGEEKSLFDSVFEFNWLKELMLDEQPIMEYSIEYGFLRLSPATRQRLNISVLLVKLGKILSDRPMEMSVFLSPID
jgi:hypothetical protein